MGTLLAAVLVLVVSASGWLSKSVAAAPSRLGKNPPEVDLQGAAGDGEIGRLLRALHHYEIVVPTTVDHSGEFIGYDVTRRLAHAHGRTKRSTADAPRLDKRIFYKLSAYGTDYRFNLTLNTRLLASRFVVQYWDGTGVTRQHRHPTPCQYVGHVVDSRHPSTVALSNCDGLHGVFSSGGEDFFVEPLHAANSSQRGAPRLHVVYRKSAVKHFHNDTTCGTSDFAPSVPSWWFASPPRNVDPTAAPTGTNRHHQRHKDKWRAFPSPGLGGRLGGRRGKRRRRGKRSVSRENYVELLLVADKLMVGYHGKENVETYILTVMNIVAKLYRDASIGNAINIVVNRLILLTEDQKHLEINHHADRSLESFCKWQRKLNTDQSNSGVDLGIASHDNAVLITRYDICTYKNEPCGTLGLAPVAGMCESGRSCSINEDIGLASAFTIAHELGHNFGMQHDGTGNLCGTPGHEGAKIMAAQLTKNTEPFTWSSCSRNYITNFLDAGRGKCLENSPLDEDEFRFPHLLPGEAHDADAQCKYLYGSLSTQCREAEVCRELWCNNPSDKCVTNNIPAAEGTTCSGPAIEKGWCYQGQCVLAEWRPVVVDGHWSDWSEWGDCSRTCGGGVTISQRLCNNPAPSTGGKYCLGERTRYRSCNIEDCPINSTDFRAVQCAQFDEMQFRGKYYTWKPFSGVGQFKPCTLNCMANSYNFYTERAPKVKDGTRCYPDKLDMCINGECMHVGCDRVLNSDAEEDICRVCGGDGTSCKTIKGAYMEPLRDKGEDSYQQILLIPQGAVHIQIQEITMSRNYLALRSVKDDKYHINGAWTIDWPRKFEVANTIFHYVRPKDNVETLSALGPTSDDLAVMILLQEPNPGIRFQYNVAVSNGTGDTTEYSWQYTSWSECTVSCARGTKTSVSVCVHRTEREIVANEHCVSHLRLKERLAYCNEQPCPPVWDIGDWSECSQSCGGGSRTRPILCVRRLGPDSRDVLTQKDCSGDVPDYRSPCNQQECPMHWATDGWSNCRPACGLGVKQRNVYCVNARGRYMHAFHCEDVKKPANREECHSSTCPPPAWVPGPWLQCSARCGKGKRRRTVKCRDYKGDDSVGCDDRTRPPTVKTCEGACLLTEITECKDVNKVAYCPLVLKFKFCSRAYFRQMCCKTCRNAGY